MLIKHHFSFDEHYVEISFLVLTQYHAKYFLNNGNKYLAHLHYLNMTQAIYILLKNNFALTHHDNEAFQECKQYYVVVCM